MVGHSRVAAVAWRAEFVQNRLPTLVYDGDCGFCACCVSLLARLTRGGYKAFPWQRADLEDLGLTPEDCRRAVQWLGAAGERAEGADAIAALLISSGRPLAGAIGRFLSSPAVAPVARRAYGLVAANRHRFPAGRLACPLRSAGQQNP
jgi:predicted DCC family thiol-disulfide oxidoreductase YuxK